MSTAIEWTDETWNPVTGCTHVSAGCDNCYARTLANGRLKDIYLRRMPAVDTPENQADPFAVRIWPDRLLDPARWREPRMVFVNSMSDLFHVDVPPEFLKSVFDAMLRTRRHTYQVLTKRPARAAKFINEYVKALPPHIWIGASVENQDAAYRVRQLTVAYAAVRFLSCEPLLGPLSLDLSGIDWVIAGGESGDGFRAPDADWVRSLRDQCQAQGVAFFFKQWGGRTPKSGGRLLDGRTWDEYPSTQVDTHRGRP